MHDIIVWLFGFVGGVVAVMLAARHDIAEDERLWRAVWQDAEQWRLLTDTLRGRGWRNITPQSILNLLPKLP